MTPNERFEALITVLGILTTGVLSIVVVAVRDHFALRELMNDVRDLVTRKEKDHDDFRQKLTQLERDQLDFYRRRRLP